MLTHFYLLASVCVCVCMCVCVRVCVLIFAGLHACGTAPRKEEGLKGAHILPSP